MLKPEGFFFGGFLFTLYQPNRSVVPDSSILWYRAVKNALENQIPYIQTLMYSAFFYSKDFSTFGTKFQLGLADGTFETDYLVHFPTLLRLAKKHGLEMIEITNFLEFFEDHNKAFDHYLKKLNVLEKDKKSLNPGQAEIIGLFTMFVFRKRLSKTE